MNSHVTRARFRTFTKQRVPTGLAVLLMLWASGYISTMKALIQTGSSGRVPVPHEKRFLINRLKHHAPGSILLVLAVCLPLAHVRALPAPLWEIPRDGIQPTAIRTFRNLVPEGALSATGYWQVGRRESEFALPATLILDLGRAYPIGAVEIYSSAGRPKTCEVYVADSHSYDIADWGVPVVTDEIPNETVWHQISFGPVEGRFLILHFTEAYLDTYMRVYELRVYAERPFVLAAPVTGNTHFSNTNTMDVVQFPAPAGYDCFLVAATNEAPDAADPRWQAFDAETPPLTATFEAPSTDGDVVVYAWFADATATLSPTGFPTTITYVRSTADVQAMAPASATAYSWNKSFPAEIRAFDLRRQVPPQHAPYLGAGSGATIGLHSLTVSCPQDETPGRDDLVTLSAPGEYTVTLTATDLAGNRDRHAVTVTVRDLVSQVAGSRFVEDWGGAANTRSWPLAGIGNGPYPPWHPLGNWRVDWPQSWLIDYAAGEQLTVDLRVLSDAAGKYAIQQQHQQLYAFLENSGALDLDYRVDFSTHGGNGTHHPGLVARFHPEDLRGAGNTRRGYMLFMQNTGEVSIMRIQGDTHVTLALVEDMVVDGQWMTARFLIEQAGKQRTRLRGKIWLLDDPEPGDWLLDVFDETPALQSPGRVGIYGRTSSGRTISLRNLEAKPLFYGTLLLVR